jgi:aminoglycoside phosphotransferase (APT) family kinase protein
VSDRPRLADLRKIGEGREAEIYAWGEGSILRLMHNPGAAEFCDRQAAAMTAAWEAGGPVPTPGQRLDVEGRPGLVMERIDGPDMLTLIGRQPWRLVGLARTLGATQARLNAVAAPPSLRPLRELLRERIEMAEALPSRFRPMALERLASLPDGDRIHHGDYHPANVLLSSRGPVVIDWTNATRGVPTADFARTSLTLRLAESPPGVSPVIRYGEKLGRGVFVGAYERAYKRRAEVDEATLPQWQIVHAAARFAEGIVGEYPVFTRFLETRLAR